MFKYLHNTNDLIASRLRILILAIFLYNNPKCFWSLAGSRSWCLSLATLTSLEFWPKISQIYLYARRRDRTQLYTRNGGVIIIHDTTAVYSTRIQSSPSCYVIIIHNCRAYGFSCWGFPYCHNDLILSANNDEASFTPVNAIWTRRQ